MKTFFENIWFGLIHGFDLLKKDSVNQKILTEIFRDTPFRGNLNDFGFSRYSQHEEDGILLYIFSKIGTTNKICVEMCSGTGFESNTANLLVNHGWHGFLFDGNENNCRKARKFYDLHKSTKIYPPLVTCSWINAKNINQLISSNITGEIDLFSLDIDGIDYFLFEALEVVTPRVVVLEINHILGFEKILSVPYDPNFKAQFSKDGSDYAGASIKAFVHLADKKGYKLIGLNRFSTNAFFIQKDIAHPDIKEVVDLSQLFKHPRVKYGMTERYKRVAHMKWIDPTSL